MKTVYLVMAQNTYVDIDGSQSDPMMFGPWDYRKNAEKAVKKLGSMTQPNYSGTGHMRLYEYVDIEERPLYDSFEDSQVMW